jgi:amidase
MASGAMAAVKPGDITALNAVALQKAIRTRAVSCVEVMGAYLDRIEQVNPAHNAIVALQPRSSCSARPASGMLSWRAASRWGRCTASRTR